MGTAMPSRTTRSAIVHKCVLPSPLVVLQMLNRCQCSAASLVSGYYCLKSKSFSLYLFVHFALFGSTLFLFGNARRGCEQPRIIGNCLDY